MANEVIDGTATPVDEPPPPAPGAAIVVRPQHEVLNVDQALKEWEAYQELTEKLLNDGDYQKIGNTKFKKKSAWRKYARAFNISCEVVYEDIVRAPDGYPLFARVRVRATDPTGRFQETDQECHINERCCDKPCRKANWDKHSCCKADCDGRTHFSHPGDLPATATTRAKNRAISDLIGAGEVSYEEMQGGEQGDGPKPAAPRRNSAPAKRPTPSASTSACWALLFKKFDRETQREEMIAFLQARIPHVIKEKAGKPPFVDMASLEQDKLEALIKELETGEAPEQEPEPEPPPEDRGEP